MTAKPRQALAGAARMAEFASSLSQEDYVRALIAANEKLVADAARARDVAGGGTTRKART